ncbi:MAG: DMT family transporter [Acetobacteraceae bacterium]|jgi:drug/metabolite transporter (DMT)-like permease|nr:DMT family transporter [Acetobacteraceae bacterium]
MTTTPVSPLVRAAGLSLAAALLFTIETVFVKLLAGSVSIGMIMLVRSGGQLLWVLPALLRRGVAIFRTNHPWLHLARGLFSLICWALYYWSFQRLDLATATVLSFTSVMFVTALAGPVLGEVVRWRRWTATIVGFIGVVIVARPFGAELNPAILVGLASALFGAGIVLTTKRLSSTEHTDTIMLYIGLVTFSGSVPAAVPDFTIPEAWQALWLGLMAITGPAGMQLWIGAFRLADASVVAPIGYTRLIFATAAGALLFNEQPDGWTGAGAVLVVGSALYITQREAAVARARARGDAARIG